MAWQDEMTEVLRVLVADTASATFSDITLQRTMAVAALQLSQQALFSQTFKGVPSSTSPNITPDPTDAVGNTRDESFLNLCCLKAACIINQGSAMTAAKQAIKVKDGSSYVDLTGILGGNLKLLEKGWCAVFDDELFKYQSGNSGEVAGACIMTPFRTVATGWSNGNYSINSVGDRYPYSSF